MILNNATIKYKGYDPKDLKPQSNKRVCRSCDNCGKVDWIIFNNYNNQKNCHNDRCMFHFNPP